MNERMLELARQAGLKKEHGADREYIGDFDWRQFGELTVRDVLAQIEEIQRLDGVLKTRVGIDFEIDVAKEVLKNYGIE